MSEHTVPGQWVCDECGFLNVRKVINPDTGAMGTDPTEDSVACPNDGKQMRRVTWKETAENLYERLNERLDDRDKRAQAEVLAACSANVEETCKILLKTDRTKDEKILIAGACTLVQSRLEVLSPAASALEALLREERKKGLELANLVYESDTNFCLTSEATRAGRMESYDVWNKIFAEAINIRVHEKEKARTEGKG